MIHDSHRNICSANLTDLLSNKEFTTTINAKDIFWFFKNKCKKLRTELNWKIGLTV